MMRLLHVPVSRATTSRCGPSRRAVLFHPLPSRGRATKRSLLAEPQSVQPVRARPCSAQEENPLFPQSLSIGAASRSGFALSTAFTRLRLGLDDVSELPERDLPQKRAQRVERGIGPEHGETAARAVADHRNLAAIARSARLART